MRKYIATALASLFTAAVMVSPVIASTGEEVITACLDGQSVQMTYDEFGEAHQTSGAYFGPCSTTSVLPDTATAPPGS